METGWVHKPRQAQHGGFEYIPLPETQRMKAENRAGIFIRHTRFDHIRPSKARMITMTSNKPTIPPGA